MLVGKVETDSGQIHVHRSAPGVLSSVASGYMDIEFADLLIRVGNEENAQHPGFTHFLDWREVTGYASEGRRRCTEWAIAQKRPFPKLHLLVRSRIVAMGVSAAGLALAVTGRELQSYTNESQFEAALGNAIRSAD